jgi:N6-L-threonylcarbamoyladenine synthase
MSPVILAIESSCDETSAAVVRQGKVLNNVIASQTIHQKYGGVVPELASRVHQQNIVPVVNEALATAGVSARELNAVAFTQGPGLMGSLLVGASFAKAMAVALEVPLIAVDHMQAHVLAHFIDEPRPTFPFLCLTVSGGHTQILLVHDYLAMEVLGETLDDAVGEAFDKAAKILGLPYPGGLLIDRYARAGNSRAFRFPESNMPGLDFSFSGIKTSMLYQVRDGVAKDPDFITKNLDSLCASYQRALIAMLMNKLEKAVQQTGIRQVAIAGGVSANSQLRLDMQHRQQHAGWQIFIPDFQYCTDNAGMIAIAAHYKYLQGLFCDLSVTPQANLQLERLS